MSLKYIAMSCNKIYLNLPRLLVSVSLAASLTNVCVLLTGDLERRAPAQGGIGGTHDMDQAPCPAMPFTSRMAFDKFQNLSEPQISHLQNRNEADSTCLRMGEN